MCSEDYNFPFGVYAKNHLLCVENNRKQVIQSIAIMKTAIIRVSGNVFHYLCIAKLWWRVTSVLTICRHQRPIDINAYYVRLFNNCFGAELAVNTTYVCPKLIADIYKKCVTTWADNGDALTAVPQWSLPADTDWASDSLNSINESANCCLNSKRLWRHVFCKMALILIIGSILMSFSESIGSNECIEMLWIAVFWSDNRTVSTCGCDERSLIINIHSYGVQ